MTSRNDRRLALSEARRTAHKAGHVADPQHVVDDIANWVAAQGGSTRIKEEPAFLIGCTEGILLVFRAILGDGMPVCVFQRLDEGFMKKLVKPYSSVYEEWVRAKPWNVSFDSAIAVTEKEMAAGQVPLRIEGVAAMVVDTETMLPLRTVLVDKTLVDSLAHNHPVPAAPLVAEGSDGAVIALLYETEPGRSVLRVERIPDEEAERLGFDLGGPTVETLRERMINHVKQTFTGPMPPDGPSALG